MTPIAPLSSMLSCESKPIHSELMLETECRWGLCCSDTALDGEESDGSLEAGWQVEAADEANVDETAVDPPRGCGSDDRC